MSSSTPSSASARKTSVVPSVNPSSTTTICLSYGAAITRRVSSAIVAHSSKTGTIT
jgi:hypothetical protein